MDQIDRPLPEIQQDRPDQETEQDANAADREADGHKDAQDGPARRAHGPQDRDIPRLRTHQHDQRRGDVERRDDDDDANDDEHDDPLQVHGLEQRRVHLPPVDHDPVTAQQWLQRRQDAVDLVGIVGLDFDDPDIVAEHQQGLSVLHRHDYEGFVVIVDADLEDRAHGVGDNSGNGANDGRAPFRADQADFAPRESP